MPENKKDEEGCCSTIPYRQLYQEYVTLDYFGALDNIFYTKNEIDAGKIRRHGFLVNKNDEDVVTWLSANNSFTWKLFDHIRIVQEKISGIFKCDNKEFQLIMHRFMKEYMFSTVYVIYSKQIKQLEIELATKLAIKNNEDVTEKINKLIPESNFRLFRRYKTENEKWVWESILAGIKDIKLDKYVKKILPLRATYNEGYMFPRVYHIYKQYEAQMQSYFRLFFTLNKSVVLSATTDKGLENKIQELYSVQPVIMNTRATSKTRAKKMELVQEIPMLKEYYDNIITLLNDELMELGLGGDSSTKCEKLTTGENFRDLLPSTMLQNSILHSLENFSEQMKKRYKQELKFDNVLSPNEQGIPLTGQQQNMNKQKPKPDAPK